MITTAGLSVRFANGEGIVYKDLAFETGRSCALLGASGCGKSTLLNMIAGVLTPTTGTVTIDGNEMTSLSQRKRDLFRIRNIGFVFQDFKLIEEMTVQDNIDVLRLEGIDTSSSDRILDSLGILKLKKKRVLLLSGGEKQRVSVARAIVKSPSIILADEPTGNLNFAIGVKIMEELTAASAGRLLICVTHDDRLCGLFDEVIDMNTVAFPLEGGEEHA